MQYHCRATQLLSAYSNYSSDKQLAWCQQNTFLKKYSTFGTSKWYIIYITYIYKWYSTFGTSSFLYARKPKVTGLLHNNNRQGSSEMWTYLNVQSTFPGVISTILSEIGIYFLGALRRVRRDKKYITVPSVCWVFLFACLVLPFLICYEFWVYLINYFLKNTIFLKDGFESS